MLSAHLNRACRRAGRTLRSALPALFGMAFAAAPAGAQVLGFEDSGIVPDATVRGVTFPLSTYGGLTWSGFGIIYTPFYSSTIASGYVQLAAATSSATIVFGASGAQISRAGGTFDFVSAYVGAAWRDGLQLTLTAYDVNNALLGAPTTLSVSRTPQFVLANLRNVSRLVFTTAGGTTVNGAPDVEQGFQFALDNVNLSTVPEPGSVALVALGLTAVGLHSRRRRRAR